MNFLFIACSMHYSKLYSIFSMSEQPLLFCSESECVMTRQTHPLSFNQLIAIGDEICIDIALSYPISSRNLDDQLNSVLHKESSISSYYQCALLPLRRVNG